MCLSVCLTTNLKILNVSVNETSYECKRDSDMTVVELGDFSNLEKCSFDKRKTRFYSLSLFFSSSSMRSFYNILNDCVVKRKKKKEKYSNACLLTLAYTHTCDYSVTHKKKRNKLNYCFNFK